MHFEQIKHWLKQLKTWFLMIIIDFGNVGGSVIFGTPKIIAGDSQ